MNLLEIIRIEERTQKKKEEEEEKDHQAKKEEERNKRVSILSKHIFRTFFYVDTFTCTI